MIDGERNNFRISEKHVENCLKNIEKSILNGQKKNVSYDVFSFHVVLTKRLKKKNCRNVFLIYIVTYIIIESVWISAQFYI